MVDTFETLQGGFQKVYEVRVRKFRSPSLRKRLVELILLFKRSEEYEGGRRGESKKGYREWWKMYSRSSD